MNQRTSFESKNSLWLYLVSSSIFCTSSSSKVISRDFKFSLILSSFWVFVTKANPLDSIQDMQTWATVHSFLSAMDLNTGSSRTAKKINVGNSMFLRRIWISYRSLIQICYRSIAACWSCFRFRAASKLGRGLPSPYTQQSCHGPCNKDVAQFD